MSHFMKTNIQKNSQKAANVRNHTARIRQTEQQRRKSRQEEETYVIGNNAVVTAPSPVELPAQRVVRPGRRSSLKMSFSYVLFLILAFGMSAYILIGYIRLQSELDTSASRVSTLTEQYNDLKVENDLHYSSIVNSVNLEEVKKIATEELGMTYAKEGQVVSYAGKVDDYVRQFSDITE